MVRTKLGTTACVCHTCLVVIIKAVARGGAPADRILTVQLHTRVTAAAVVHGTLLGVQLAVRTAQPRASAFAFVASGIVALDAAAFTAGGCSAR